MTRKKQLLTVSIILLVLGIGIFLYPTILQQFNEFKFSKTISDFNKNVNEMNNQANASSTTEQEDDLKYNKTLLDKLYQDMQAYNKDLSENGQSTFGDPFAYAEPSFDLSKYGIDDSIFGYIAAPAIDLELPIYLGASKENMKYGAAHLTRTSVPIGGDNTNAVLAAHTGAVSRKYFDNIVNLKEGDDVYVTNFWDTLHYKVAQIRIIYPTETGNILIEDGKDLLTLVTCYPYGYNTHRYVVICERVEE